MEMFRKDGRLHAYDRELPPGPWHDEPDRETFMHAGLSCLLRRAGMAAWCGYVGVPPGHPWHGKHYDAIDCSVHGGLTYAGNAPGKDPDNRFEALAMELFESLHWVGFDCNHYMDLAPGMLAVRGVLSENNPTMPKTYPYMLEEVYRDIVYVRAETISLAEQAERSA